MYLAQTSQLRPLVAALVVVLIATACGSSAPTQSPSSQPSGQQTASPGGTSRAATPSPTDTNPPASGEPGPTPGPETPLEPLQAPQLTSTDDIAEALMQPDLAEQAVVSMLQVLGIGLYNDDGTPIRPGSELSDSDFFLSDSEARGLIKMLQNSDQPDSWITFREFHSAMTALGYQGTAEQLAAAYNDTYAAIPDDPIVRFINASAFIDVDASFSRFGAWLLLLDGFVPPNARSAAPEAASAPARAVAAAARAGGGVSLASAPPVPYTLGRFARARDRIIPNRVITNADPAFVARLMANVNQFTVKVRANPRTVHEGHTGTGPPVKFVADVIAGPVLSPFSGNVIVPATRPEAGLALTWRPDDVLNRHGVTAPMNGTTSPSGDAVTMYTPNHEKAAGFGASISETGTMVAAVSAKDIITRLYNLPGLEDLVSGEVTGPGPLVVQWHDEVIDIDLTNKYDVTIKLLGTFTRTTGTDTFVGQLARTEEGRWVGTVTANARGDFTGKAFGGDCSSSWDVTQLLFVVATEVTGRTDGNFVIQFYPGQPPNRLPSGKCPPTLHKRNGMYYAPFNDYSVTTPDEGGALVFILPPKPGGTQTYPVPNPGGTDIIIKNTSWVVKITYPSPP